MPRQAYSKLQPSKEYLPIILKRTALAPGYSNYYYTYGQYLDTSKTRYGELFPEWRQAIANHENATTSLDQSLTKILNLRPMSLESRWGVREGVYPAFITSIWDKTFSSSPLAIDTAVEADVRNLAIGKAYLALNRAFEGIPLLKDLSELVGFIKAHKSVMWKHIKDYRRNWAKARNNYKTLQSWNKAAANAWLEYSFVLAPLSHLGDDLLDQYFTALEKETSIPFRVAAIGEKLSPKTTTTAGFDSFTWSINKVGMTTTRVKIQGSARLRVGADISRPSASLGFEPASWLPAAWEILPYSWAIDYFTNLDAVINAAVTCSLYESYYAWITTSTETVTTTSTELVGFPAPSEKAQITRRIDGQSQVLRKRVTRQNVTDLPIPYLMSELDLKPSQALNCVAVLYKWLEEDRRYAKRAFPSTI